MTIMICDYNVDKGDYNDEFYTDCFLCDDKLSFLCDNKLQNKVNNNFKRNDIAAGRDIKIRAANIQPPVVVVRDSGPDVRGRRHNNVIDHPLDQLHRLVAQEDELSFH